jgi:hypothetical protein
MMASTAIEWATDVWNPVVGCTRASAGCKSAINLKDPKGGNIAEWPEDLRVREFPKK